MSIRTALLTTDTSHHLFYAVAIARRFPWQVILLERQVLTPLFETLHPFEKRRDTWEREVLLNDHTQSFDALTATHHVDDINSAVSIKLLQDATPDVLLVFGTGRVRRQTLQALPRRWWNLHGGNPEEYRGLDSHLWTIYHRDFANLMSTVHVIDDRIDTGAIIGRSAIPLHRSMPIHELRAANTGVCVELSIAALHDLSETGDVRVRPQRSVGRYYSFMPAVMKEDCVGKFERHVAAL